MTALSEKFRPPSLALARIGIGRRLDCLDPDGVRGRGNQMASERASVSRPSANDLEISQPEIREKGALLPAAGLPPDHLSKSLALPSRSRVFKWTDKLSWRGPNGVDGPLGHPGIFNSTNYVSPACWLQLSPGRLTSIEI